MSTKRQQLAEVIGQRTMHASNTKELVREVAAYILSENLTAQFESLMRDIMQYRAEHGIIEAVAVSAHELGDEVHREIKQLLQTELPHAKSILVRGKHDDSVIGGVRVELPNQQLDLTIRRKLATFKRLTIGAKE